MTPSSLPAESVHADPVFRKQQILAAQVRLLYGNANAGIGVTLVATIILARLHWGVLPHAPIVAWCLYMYLVSAARFILRRRYGRIARKHAGENYWGTAFAIGAGLAGAGWGAAGILLYPEAHLANQMI